MSEKISVDKIVDVFKELIKFSSIESIIAVVSLGVILAVLLYEIVRAIVVSIANSGTKRYTYKTEPERIIEPEPEAISEVLETVEEPEPVEPEPKIIEETVEIEVVEEVVETIEEPEPVEEPVEPEPEVIEEPVEPEPVIIEVVKEVVVTEEAKPEIVVGDLENDLDVIKRIPFKDKILSAEDKIKDYYTQVDNALRAYRKINSRVSIKGVSYRHGRKLIAKMTIRGRTLKLHLALDVNEFDQGVYFQKDMSDVREYVEVPFAVKIRSDRAMKNTLVLIEKLCEKHGVEKKARFVKVDSIAELKKDQGEEEQNQAE